MKWELQQMARNHRELSEELQRVKFVAQRLDHPLAKRLQVRGWVGGKAGPDCKMEQGHSADLLRGQAASGRGSCVRCAVAAGHASAALQVC